MAALRLFSWQALDNTGGFHQGTFFCQSQEQVIERLVAAGHIPLRLSRGKRCRTRAWQGGNKTACFRQLSTLLKAGLTLSASLGLLAEDHADAGWQALLVEIQQRVSEGVPFSEALAQWPEVFPPLYAALMKVGELTGRLDECCLQLASQQERQQQLQKKMMKALRYPLFILALALIVSYGMLVWILPEFAAVYQSFDAPLPAFTSQVIALSEWLQRYGLVLLPLMALFPIGWKGMNRLPMAWQRSMQRGLLTLPLAGKLYKGAQLSAIFTTLSLTQQAGLTLLQSLQAVEQMLSQRIWRECIGQLQLHISAGNPLHQALKQHPLFTPICGQLIKVGEEAGMLDSMLARLARLHEESTHERADTLAAALEPLMMVVTGLIVGALVVAMYLPVFNLGDALGG
ncbi:protein transport protein HofC [Erwinia sp. P6884]|uniref:protein transport protein HofC n=1 Tax=Erwinia sp. P6884 TaxID=3141450 RepID=UPI00319BA999